jgi:hypothetical protein
MTIDSDVPHTKADVCGSDAQIAERYFVKRVVATWETLHEWLGQLEFLRRDGLLRLSDQQEVKGQKNIAEYLNVSSDRRVRKILKDPKMARTIHKVGKLYTANQMALAVEVLLRPVELSETRSLHAQSAPRSNGKFK